MTEPKKKPQPPRSILDPDFQYAEGLNGGFVFLGVRTSQMSRRRFSEFLEFVRAVAAERGVEIRERETA